MIPNGVDEQLLHIERDYTAIHSRPIRLLTVSALIKRKAVSRIIEALAEVTADPLPTLTIVGDGPEYENLRSLVTRLKLDERVEFAGYADPDTIHRYLAAADIFVLASESEGRPNVILEAMASGMAIISSRIDGVIELIDDGKSGLLFEMGNAGDLAGKISQLASAPELMQQMGHAARSFIKDKGLLWPNTGLRYAELYRQCMDGKDQAL